MADDAIDPLQPLRGKQPIQPHGEPESRERPYPGRVLRGRIVSVRPGHPHDGETHVLDVTVGGSRYTEIIVRVPQGDLGRLEGHDVTLHVEP